MFFIINNETTLTAMKKIFLILLILMMVSCKTQNILYDKKLKPNTTISTEEQISHQIKIGDKISISVWGEDELSVGSIYGIYNSNEVYGKWLMVDKNGLISIPHIGNKYVLGSTIISLKKELEKEFQKLLTNPIIDIKILNKEIVILGEVRTPNTYIIDKESIDLLNLIGKAGGFEFYADLSKIQILRTHNSEKIILDLTRTYQYNPQNVQIYPGDVVIIPSKKNKEFDKRISTIIPFTTAISAIAILLGLF